VEKVVRSSLQQLLESTKKNWSSQAFVFEIISLASQKNADISIILKKEGTDTVFLHRFSYKLFAFLYRKVTTFIKILRLHGK